MIIGSQEPDYWDSYNRYLPICGHPEPFGRPSRTCSPQSSRLARMLQCREGSSRELRHTATSEHGPIRRAAIFRIASLRPHQCLSSPFLLIHGPMWSRREFAFADTSVPTCVPAADQTEQEISQRHFPYAPCIVVLAPSAYAAWNRQLDGMEHDDGLLANLL